MNTMLRSLLYIALIAVALTSARPARADLITNGGFETADFTGWTQSGDTDFTGVSFGNTHSGDWVAFAGPDGSLGFLSQVVATTPGIAYTLTFFLQSDGSTPNEFQATLGTSTVDFHDLPEFDFMQGSLTFVATDATTLVQFGFRNDNGAFFLDDVSLNAVPEPGTMAMFAIGGVGVLHWFGRRARKVGRNTV